MFHVSGVSLSTPSGQKKGFGRPKSAEPGSPLLRRALSPDRLHPRSAESKTSISPLANTVLKVIPRVTIAQTSITDTVNEASNHLKETVDTKAEKKSSEQKPSGEYPKLAHGMSINIPNVGIPSSTQLPRIAEEKDSPTGSKSDDYSSRSVGKLEGVVTETVSKTSEPSDSKKDLKDCAFVATRKGVLNAVERLQSASESAAAIERSDIPSFRSRKSEGVIPQRKFSVVESKLCAKNWLDAVADGETSKPPKPIEPPTKQMSTLMQRKASVFDLKVTDKSWIDAGSEGRKILKRYKVDSEIPSSSQEKNSPADNKKNN